MDFSEMGKRIQKKRKEQKMTQEDLAEKIGVSSAYVGMIERGERAPSLDTFVLLTNTLGVSADELLSDLVYKCRNTRLARYEAALFSVSGAKTERIFKMMDIMLEED